MVFQSSEAKWMLGWGHEEKKRIEESCQRENSATSWQNFQLPLHILSQLSVFFVTSQIWMFIMCNEMINAHLMLWVWGRDSLCLQCLKENHENPPTIISKAVTIYTLASHFIMVHTFCIHPPGQYLEPILAAIIALSLLQYVSINPNICILISLPICLGKIAQAVRLNGDCW